MLAHVDLLGVAVDKPDGLIGGGSDVLKQGHRPFHGASLPGGFICLQRLEALHFFSDPVHVFLQSFELADVELPAAGDDTSGGTHHAGMAASS